MLATDPNLGALLGTDLQNHGVRFPIFEDPLSAIGLLFNKDVTFVTWNLPTFEATAHIDDFYLGTIPVGPVPVNVELGFHVGVEFTVGLGFDSRGLRSGNTFIDGFFFQEAALPVRPSWVLAGELACKGRRGFRASSKQACRAG